MEVEDIEGPVELAKNDSDDETAEVRLQWHDLKYLYVTGSAKTLHVRMQILTHFYNFKMP